MSMPRPCGCSRSPKCRVSAISSPTTTKGRGRAGRPSQVVITVKYNIVIYMYVQCCGFESHLSSSFFFGKQSCHGCCCIVLYCVALLFCCLSRKNVVSYAFLPSHPGTNNGCCINRVNQQKLAIWASGKQVVWRRWTYCLQTIV